jgi:hypothetical protein
MDDFLASVGSFWKNLGLADARERLRGVDALDHDLVLSHLPLMDGG